MKKLITLTAFALLLSMAGSAYATIGWAGNVWPNDGANFTSNDVIDVYVQVWKAGVTDAAGQGADIMVEMNITNDIGGSSYVVLAYKGDVGSNDEYTGVVTPSLLAGATVVTVDFVVTDLTDGTTYSPINDQAGNPAPLSYNVVGVLPDDVDVTFSVCLSGAGTSGDVCVVGSTTNLTEWGAGVPLTHVSGDLYEGTITFLADSNPSFQYKFKKDGCVTWETTANRDVTLPLDGTMAVTLETDSWEFLPIGCGLGNTLEEDKEVCFQVCMEGVENSGGVCLMGPTDWVTGDAMTELSGNLYQVCLVYPAGTAIPLNVEYKFTKDNCSTWESVGNRVAVIDNSLAAETTLTSSWDELGGTCAPVPNEAQSWDSLKTLYR